MLNINVTKLDPLSKEDVFLGAKTLVPNIQ